MLGSQGRGEGRGQGREVMFGVGGQVQGSRSGLNVGGSRSGVKVRGQWEGSRSGGSGVGVRGHSGLVGGRLKIKKIMFLSRTRNRIPFQSNPFHSMFYPLPCITYHVTSIHLQYIRST